MSDERNMATRPVSAITRDTVVPLGGALVIAWTLFLAVSKFQDERRAADTKLETRFTLIEARLAAAETRLSSLERVRANRWSCADHEQFVLRLRIANPSFVIPARHRACGPGEEEEEHSGVAQ